ncbi:MAG: PilZ domain-containing protein [Acidobacteriia bacterium]|nr:PilZ domain-containing protein [Terriglobia bacterium]
MAIALEKQQGYNLSVQSPQETSAPSAETGTRQRRTERVKLSIPIRVMCFGGSAGDFVENTITIMVNRDGALIALVHRVAADDTLRIVNLENFREADFRVVGETRLESAEFSGWGVECLEKERTLWDIDFPPPLDPGGSSAGALLECLGCGKQGLLVLSLVEFDLLESAGTLQKLCDKCGQLSTWTYADVTRRPKQMPPVQAPAAAQPPVSPRVGKWDGTIERRVFKRMAVKLRALVRNSKGQQEIVKTENLSKGGLALCLKMELALGEFVTVICPYSGGVEEFERKAEVRYRASHFAGQNWFYGLRYFRG